VKGGIKETFKETFQTTKDMPGSMEMVLPMMFFSWYTVFIYWQFITLSLSKAFYETTDTASATFKHSKLLTGLISAFYNFIAFISVLGMAL
jgi:maltose/moltooligosaccharide transporter